MATATFSIGGADKTTVVRAASNFRVEYTLGALTPCSFEVQAIAGDAGDDYRPAIDDAVEVVAGIATLFKGRVLGVEHSAPYGRTIGIVTKVSAVGDWRSAAQRRVTTRTYTEQTLKVIVTDLTTLLSPFGITLDPGMGVGPTLTVTFDYVTVVKAFASLSELTGWVHRLLPTGVVEWFPVGDRVATFSLDETNVFQGETVSQSREKFINTWYVNYGTASQVVKTDTFIGNAVISAWVLTYQAIPSPNGSYSSRGLVTEDAADLPLGVYGVDPTLYTYDQPSNTLHRTSAPGVGAVISMPYTVQFPLTVSAIDAASVTADGPWEDKIDKPDVFDLAEAQAYADALLRRYGPDADLPREIRNVRTDAGLSFPGDVVEVTLNEFDVAGGWLITSARVLDREDASLTYEYTCIEGSESQGSWIDFWQGALGGVSGGSGGTVTGVLIPPGSGSGGGTVATGRVPIFVGGSETEYVQSPTPTWVPASAVRFTLDTAARGTAATLRLRLRAQDGTVLARLYDITNAVSAGISSLVSSSAWTDVVFAATLSTGIAVYEVQLLPNLQDSPVAGVGFLE